MTIVYENTVVTSEPIIEAIGKDISVNVYGHTVNITNKPENTETTVYRIDGQVECATTADTFTLSPGSRIVMIRVAGRTFKVALR